jgi:hypothetical protein
MNLYYNFDPETSIITNHHQYAPGMYYREYYLEDGFLNIKNICSPRVRSIKEQELYVIDLINQVSDKQILIMHNHVDPIDPYVRSRLMSKGQNIYIYRKDKRQQLSSYAIAYSTKQFASFNKEHTTTNTLIAKDLEPSILHSVIKRIQVWDKLEKGREQIVAYEDIDFREIPNFPCKQNKDHNSRLSDKMITMINELVINYEKESLQ